MCCLLFAGKIVLVSVFALGSWCRADDLPQFEGYFTGSANSDYYFFLSNTGDEVSNLKTVSSKLRLGESFTGWVLEKFVPEEESVVVRKQSKLLTLRLKSSPVVSAVVVHEKHLADLNGLELARELARRGNVYFSNKIEALETLYRLEEVIKKRVDLQNRKVPEMLAKLSDSEANNEIRKKLLDQLGKLNISYETNLRDHVKLEQLIERDAFEALSQLEAGTLTSRDGRPVRR